MSGFTTRDDLTTSTAPRPPIEVRNEAVIRASVERVWDLLTRRRRVAVVVPGLPVGPCRIT
jgi:hypothetical protein